MATKSRKNILNVLFLKMIFLQLFAPDGDGWLYKTHLKERLTQLQQD